MICGKCDATIPEESIYTATNGAGWEPMEGTFTLSGETLVLSGDIEGEFVYDSATQCFLSTTNKRLVQQDFADENGVYHEAVWEYGKLEPRQIYGVVIRLKG